MPLSRRSRITFMIAALVTIFIIFRHDDAARWIDAYQTRANVLVQDSTSLLSDRQKQHIAQYHNAMRDNHDIDLRVAIHNNTGDINKAAYTLFQNENIGDLSQSGRGLLLLIDPAQDEVRLEVSTSLEPVYTDAFVAYIQNRQMVPFFNANRLADGILATTEMIVTRAQDAHNGKEFLPPSDTTKSAGGGATTTAGIGENTAPAYSSKETEIPTNGQTPQEIVQTYIQAMANRDARPDLPIYSQAAQKMMRDWVVTPAQMDNLARTYQNCTYDGTYTLGGLAVVRYQVEQRQCSPFFLHWENGGWKLDLQLMSSLIRFNHNNAWRFSGQRHPYGFAFGDWSFDRNGFPHAMKTKKLRWQLSTQTMGEYTYVTWVGDGSPAEQLGLRYGDAVLDWNGQAVTTAGQLIRMMNQANPGQTVTAKIRRNHNLMTLETQAPPKP